MISAELRRVIQSLLASAGLQPRGSPRSGA